MIVFKNQYIYIYKRCIKNMKPLWKVINIYTCADTYTHTHTHTLTFTLTLTLILTHTHTHTHTHIHKHIYILVEEGEEGGDKLNQLTADSLRSVPQDN